ncbi:MAG: peptide chain release factor 2 [Candidatus Nomurabacteria bacterium]|jgi:peptide chain release factor 2|nr:peptide chain release factor 2 [Candidatus Nomurabacteria bacterium]
MEKQIKRISDEITEAWQRLDLTARQTEIAQLERELADAAVWQDNTAAQEKSRRLADLKKVVDAWAALRDQVDDLAELAQDASLAEELAEQVAAAESELAELKKQLRFQGPYDAGGAILRLSAGAGGDDAQDWTEMLERMYLRWAEKSDHTARIVERSAGETAGVKTSVIEVTGPFAYGKLRGENGVHRLVRLSPFNAESRETSFARVEVLPLLERPEAVPLNEKDLRIDVYRSSGHGGQSVNTTDSAVRVTHLPTGTTVAIQNEKSQLKNKEEALKILRSKLAALQMEQHAENIAELKGEAKSAAWGQQIRNYVLHPYKLVKDTRTGQETANVEKVLSGEIDEFIDAYLELGDDGR